MADDTGPLGQMATLLRVKAEAAEVTARALLGTLQPRLSHVIAVARLARYVAVRLEVDPEVLVSAAWLHDVGYAPHVAATGFHPLDGARFLRQAGVPASVINLVAHHSFAVVEAELRGLRTALENEFPYDPSLPHDVLCYCDMTTGPAGKRVTVDERLSEIRARYGPNDVVTQFIARAETDIVETVGRIEKRVAEASQSK